MAKCPPCDCKAGLPLWIGTFGDLMSLLLTFFILLLSMASFDAKKLTEAEASLKGALSILDGGIKLDWSRNRIQLPADMVPDEETTDEIRMLEVETIEDAFNTKLSKGPSPTEDILNDGFVLRLPAGVEFAKGSADIKTEDTRLFLRRIADILSTLPETMSVEVRGYGDKEGTLATSIYKDSFELSIARSLTMTKELINQGLSPSKIHTLGKNNYRNQDGVNTDATKTIEIHFVSNNKAIKPPQDALEALIELNKGK